MSQVESFPSLDESLAMLAEISGCDAAVIGSMKLVDADIDSLDVLEWSFNLEVDLEEAFTEDELINLGDLTLAEIYERIASSRAGVVT